MAETRTPQPQLEGKGCAHVYTRTIGPYVKCTACGEVIVEATTYDANCPDCEFETHRWNSKPTGAAIVVKPSTIR